MQKVSLLLFKLRKSLTPVEGWFLILHCFLLSGCMWWKPFKNEKLSPSRSSLENGNLLHILESPSKKKKILSSQIAQYQGRTEQRQRTASGAEAASAAGTHQAQWSGLAALKNTSLMTGSRTFLSETNCCDRARGKGAVRVLDSGAFKAYLVVNMSQGVSALIPVLVSSVAEVHLNYVNCCLWIAAQKLPGYSVALMTWMKLLKS